MKRILVLTAVLLVTGSALYLAQRRHRHDAVSANAVVDVLADWQRDASRVPLHFTRLSDSEETQIGNQLAQQYTSESPALTAMSTGRDGSAATAKSFAPTVVTPWLDEGRQPNVTSASAHGIRDGKAIRLCVCIVQASLRTHSSR